MNENLRQDSELLKRKETLLKAALTYNELACRLRQEAISIR